MTPEEKELLLSLLLKSNEEGLLNIFDSEENYYELNWAFIDSELCLKIKKI